MCDVLVIKALEKLGKYLVRKDGSRYRERQRIEWHEAHLIWQPTPAVVDRVLSDAWEVVPALVDTYGVSETTSEDVIAMLSAYARGLAISGRPHTSEQLQQQFADVLGIPVFDMDETETLHHAHS